MNTPEASLSARQQGIVQRIFSMASHPSAGLKIYQSNLLMTAQRALTIAYPHLNTMVGEEALSALTRTLLRHETLETGDWADWGLSLAEQIAASALAETHPYLPDMARLEWKIHLASRAAENSPDLHSLQLLQEQDPADVFIQLAPAVDVMSSPYPVGLLWQAHEDAQDKAIDLPALQNALAAHSGEPGLLIYRQHNTVRLKALTDTEYAWYCDLLRGLNLACLMDRYPQLDFAHWLTEALQLPLISRVQKTVSY